MQVPSKLISNSSNVYCTSEGREVWYMPLDLDFWKRSTLKERRKFKNNNNIN
jgi:hypothetical protein